MRCETLRAGVHGVASTVHCMHRQGIDVWLGEPPPALHPSPYRAVSRISNMKMSVLARPLRSSVHTIRLPQMSGRR